MLYKNIHFFLTCFAGIEINNLHKFISRMGQIILLPLFVNILIYLKVIMKHSFVHLQTCVQLPVCMLSGRLSV